MIGFAAREMAVASAIFQQFLRVAGVTALGGVDEGRDSLHNATPRLTAEGKNQQRSANRLLNSPRHSLLPATSQRSLVTNITCPACGRQYGFNPQMAGRQVRCQSCGHTF